MTIKRTIPVFLIFITSIVLGVFYNSCLIEYPYSFGNTSMLPRYLMGILMYLMFFVLGALLHYSFMYTFEKHKNKFVLLVGHMLFATLGIYILSKTYFGINYLNAFVMIFIYPFAFLGVALQQHKKRGLIYATIIFLILMVACLIVSDIKMVLFSTILFIISELLAIKLVNPPNSKSWYWHAGGLSVFTVLFFIATMLLKWDVFSRRILGFFQPNNVLEYEMLLQWLRSCEFISYAPNKLFVSDINSMTACPYAHIMTCFGILPTFVIIGLQAYMVFCMFRNSNKFVNTQRKLLGMVAASATGLHLALSVFSSFYVIPMVGYGGPFILTTGMTLSYIPILLYFYLECIEFYKLREKKSVYKKRKVE